MTVEKLARFLNQISQTDYHYDDMPEKIKNAYRHKAKLILDFLGTDPAREGGQDRESYSTEEDEE